MNTISLFDLTNNIEPIKCNFQRPASYIGKSLGAVLGFPNVLILNTGNTFRNVNAYKTLHEQSVNKVKHISKMKSCWLNLDMVMKHRSVLFPDRSCHLAFIRAGFWVCFHHLFVLLEREVCIYHGANALLKTVQEHNLFHLVCYCLNKLSWIYHQQPNSRFLHFLGICMWRTHCLHARLFSRALQ